MIPEFQLPITRCDASGILLALLNFALFLILRSDIQRMRGNHALRYNQGTQRKRVTKNIRRTAIDLSGDDTGAVADCLLDTNGECSTVMRCDVDVQPGDVQANAGVRSYAAEECCEVSNCIIGNSQKQNVPDDAENV